MLEVVPQTVRQLMEFRTAGYRPSGWGLALPALTSLGLPVFTIRHVEQMKFDGDIRLGMAIKYAPCLTVKFNIDGDPAVAEYVKRQITTTWYYTMPRVLEGRWYTRSGGENLFKLGDDGLVHLAGLRDVYSADMSILTRTGILAGIRIHAHSGTEAGPTYEGDEKSELTDKGEIKLLAPKSFVYVHNRRFSSWNGRSDLLGCYKTWLEKWDQRGALALRLMWFYKNVYSGWGIQHPPGDYTWQDSNGVIQKIPYRDLARQMVESITAGAVWGYPAVFDEKGNPMWAIIEPKFNGEAQGLHDYLKELRGETLHGLEIPDDIVTAVSESGSRAGRSVPFRAFILSEQQTVRQIALDEKEQVWDPLVQLNFGKVDYDVQAEVDIERLMPDELTGEGGDPADAIDGADNMEGPDTRSMKKRADDAQQFSMDDSSIRPRHRKIFKKAAAAFGGYAATDLRFTVNGGRQRLGHFNGFGPGRNGQTDFFVGRPPRGDETVQMAIRHAPKNGIRIANQFFEGGEFIPSEALEQATPEQQAQLEENPEPKKTPERKGFKAWFSDSEVTDEKGRPLVVFHGTGKDFDQFQSRIGGNTQSSMIGVPCYFFASNPDVADSYAQTEGGNIRPVYLSIQHPLRINANGESWADSLGEVADNIETYRTEEERRFKQLRWDLLQEYPGWAEYDDLGPPQQDLAKLEAMRKTLEHDIIANKKKYDADPAGVIGYDGIIIKNSYDLTSAEPGAESYNPFTDVYIVFKPDQIKSAIGEKKQQMSMDGRIEQMSAGKKTLPIFVYGSLKSGSLFAKVVGHEVSMTADSIEGYEHKEFDEGFSDLNPDPDHEVSGFRVNVSADDLKALDDWEHKFYRRKRVVLESGIAAWAFWPTKRLP